MKNKIVQVSIFRNLTGTVIFLLALVGTFAGCGKENIPLPDKDTASAGGFEFSVSVPEATSMMTRSLSSESLSELWVLVFDDQGFFVEAQKATPVDPTSFSTDENAEYKFTVTLQASPSSRTLHFIGDYDFEANPVVYGTEYYVLRRLSVRDNQDAYWQRVILPGGILSAEEMDQMSDEKKEAYLENSGLRRIPLVRNFARVHVESATDDFKITGYALWNIPDRGCVAPCVMSHNSFATYAKADTEGDSFTGNPWVSRSYDELTSSYDGSTSAGFFGYLPQDVEIVQSDASVLTFDNSDKFLYERPYSEDVSNTAIIVKGSFDGNADSYYKIDFVKAAENGFVTYYNILRNFIYSATIVSCTSDGYSSAAEAAAAPASNNFVSSVVTQDIVNISDGTSRMYVSYTDTTVVSTDPFSFRYKYIPDYRNNPTVIDNSQIRPYDTVTGTAPANDGTGSVIKTYTSEDDSDGWKRVTINPQTPTDEEKTQTVIFYEPREEGGAVKIARTIVYRLRKPFTMVLECSPSTVSASVGQELTMNIKIPTGLRQHLFPLEFKMESEANSLTPDNSKAEDAHKSGYMATWYGTSMLDSTKRSYGFTKTITYAEYMALESTADNSYKILPCSFKTSKASSATKVWVYNKYFYYGDGLSTVSFDN